MSFIDEWEAEKDRLSRIETQLAVTPPHQLRRLESEKNKAALALARVFGSRLDEAVADRIIEGMVLDPSVICTIGGGVRELPNDAKGWDAWARYAVEKEPLAKLSIDSSDAALKEQLSQEVLSSIPPAKRMDMARNGRLDAFIEAEVKARIEARSGV